MDESGKKLTRKAFGEAMKSRISEHLGVGPKATQGAIEKAFLNKYGSVLEARSPVEAKLGESVNNLLAKLSQQVEDWDIEINYLLMQMYDEKSGLDKALKIYGEIIVAEVKQRKLFRTAEETLTAGERDSLKRLNERLEIFKRKLTSFYNNA